MGDFAFKAIGCVCVTQGQSNETRYLWVLSLTTSAFSQTLNLCDFIAFLD